MLPKLFIVLVLLVILGSLASGLIFLIKDKGDSDRTVKALTWRIGLSVTLFLLLMLGYATGVLQPHGVYPHPPAQPTEGNAPATGNRP
ncbi:twin transmembrane helix small protein [Thiohalobacter thiocyanaticus]|uniref:Twin transmembrane helix small protein n=1 Tax=Thiohalobacter thiocyanaticus TaxID=585455 RepID=A0A426QN48_9GAMM|nr:twin transmembrane helix small protein [Thiohalobacter thiocyanaticus]RRQ23096.1 twin transmembrane helix small protein [Thiohalobacter thiocyanaticus]